MPWLKKYRNIIFDFGGVICDIDPSRTRDLFIKFGIKSREAVQNITDTGGLYNQLEMGLISPATFRESLKSVFLKPVTDNEIDVAWNALLLEIPEHRIRFLEKVRQTHELFLLSNTNAIHYQCFIKSFRQKYGYEDFNGLFRKCYFSYLLNLRKPDPAIFTFVLKDAGLNASETLFIDDSEENINGAEKVGIKGILISSGQDFVSLLE